MYRFMCRYGQNYRQWTLFRVYLYSGDSECSPESFSNLVHNNSYCTLGKGCCMSPSFLSRVPSYSFYADADMHLF